MAIIVNEKRAIDENVFKYENRLKSPTSRFLESTPVFVDYYHINYDETTTDSGYKDVQSIIGNQSPIKYNKIEGFPLYGIEQVVLQLAQDDQGLDTTFEGTGIIPINTIKPLPNDYFTIPTLKDDFLFRVTDIDYDTAMPDNFYRISFMLEYIDPVKIEELNKQIYEEFTCILENIGSDNNPIIEKSVYKKIEDVKKVYDEIANTYFSIFYNERYNVFLGEIESNKYLYDPFQVEFINRHQLFNSKNNLKSLQLSQYAADEKSRIKYEKSVYRFMERPDVKFISNFNYVIYQGIGRKNSAFQKWYDPSVYVLDLVHNEYQLEVYSVFSNEFVTSVQLNGPTSSSWSKLLQSYIRRENITLSDIDLSMHEIMYDFDNHLEIFFTAPIVLYILKNIMNDSISVK